LDGKSKQLSIYSGSCVMTIRQLCHDHYMKQIKMDWARWTYGGTRSNTKHNIIQVTLKSKWIQESVQWRYFIVNF